MDKIIQYLRKNGSQLDSEIADGTGISLEEVRREIATLSAKGQIVMYRTTRVTEGQKIEGTLYRAIGCASRSKSRGKSVSFGGGIHERQSK